MTWNVFAFFALPAMLLAFSGAVFALKKRTGRSTLALWLTAGAVAVYTCFVAGRWLSLGRPPLRTLGETRLWYSLFMLVSGWLVYYRWHYRWILLFSLVVAAVFMVINLLKPELHDQTLMPALQSAWFVPHVTVYMFSYSLFGVAFLLGVAALWQHTGRFLPAADRLVGIGFFFLTMGMLSGCLWAKQAWGNYWSWDPKETWAAATWCTYLIYIHLRPMREKRERRKHRITGRDAWACVWLIAGFLLLQMCWYGVNFLPGAVGSLHSYS